MNEMSSTTKQPQIVETISQMFQEAGIKEHEPQLVVQLSDLAYSLTKEILLDAKSLSEFSNRKQISKQDVEFTIKTFQEKHKPMRPPKDVLVELAAQKNAQPLQPLRQNFGLRLPNDRFCQVQPNYEYVVSGEAIQNGNGGAPIPAKRRAIGGPESYNALSAEYVSHMLDTHQPNQHADMSMDHRMEEDFD